jgi:tRNA(fMet)-specific endonuclease VapC
VILLDTDHISLLKCPASECGARFIERLDTLPASEVIGVVSIEEQMRGWMAAIAKERQAKRQVTAYRELAKLFKFFAEFTIIPFDDAAADQFDQLRSAKIRIGTMDLKKAATALVNQALHLSANSRDFERVLGLTTRRTPRRCGL